LCKSDALQAAASNPPSLSEAGDSADVTDNDTNIGSMPGTPTRSSLREESVTLEAADTGDVEEARPPSGQMQALSPTSSPRETGGSQGRTPPPLPLPSASAANHGSHDWVAGQP
jgi:hypothetical protein